VKAVLLLEDGTFFQGAAFGARGQMCGEVVFNTSMTGYQEIMTDPSYHEQIITMTYPLIGNVGANPQDWESKKVYACGFIVKENCDYPSNWRSKASLEQYLKKNNVVGLEGIDTRALVKHIRTKGAMKGIISSTELEVKKLQKKLQEYPGLVGRDIVKDVTCKSPYHWDQKVDGRWMMDDGRRPSSLVSRPSSIEGTNSKKYKVVAYDYGAKQNILRLLRSHGCDVYVVPAQTPAYNVLAQKPDGIFLSNGPGDPAAVTYAIDNVRHLLGKVPMFGICLGHQLMALALGAKTYKLKFGHRGANHPVKNLRTKRIEITCQNHGFCVDMETLKGKDIELTHINLNDNTVEGFRCHKLNAFCVQYHPEASPGPHDSRYLFADFIALMEQHRTKR
jgi:carbamoyl-phosphate synthase small subunit